MDGIGKLNALFASGESRPLGKVKPSEEIGELFKTDPLAKDKGFYPGLSLSNNLSSTTMNTLTKLDGQITPEMGEDLTSDVVIDYTKFY